MTLRAFGLGAIIFLGPLFVMVLVYVFGHLMTRWQYRRRYGISWNDLVAEADAGHGTLVVDFGVSRARGLSRVEIWWLPQRVPHALIAASWIPSKGRLVSCPKELRSLEALKARFPDMPILENHSTVVRR